MIHKGEVQLIDFDDAGFGWHMFEIATAPHWLVEEPQFHLMKASVLDGYQRLRPLTQQDLDALQLFHVARSLTYLGWVHTRSQTETAIEMTPVVIDIAASLGEQYLAAR
jgi:Ser/Thr protein kinase RdoA (MazF antagonist)